MIYERDCDEKQSRFFFSMKIVFSYRKLKMMYEKWIFFQFFIKKEVIFD